MNCAVWYQWNWKIVYMVSSEETYIKKEFHGRPYSQTKVAMIHILYA